jgi:hypothetical protein
VIDGKLTVRVQRKVPNDLSRIIELIEPYRKRLEIVVESAFNWYWLVDGLREAGFSPFVLLLLLATDRSIRYLNIRVIRKRPFMRLSLNSVGANLFACA